MCWPQAQEASANLMLMLYPKLSIHLEHIYFTAVYAQGDPSVPLKSIAKMKSGVVGEPWKTSTWSPLVDRDSAVPVHGETMDEYLIIVPAARPAAGVV